MSNPKHIVILGSSYASLMITHLILKHIAPTTPVKVTIIGPSDQLYWIPGAPRTILNLPSRLPIEKVLQSIPEALRTTYGADKEGKWWEYKVAWARNVDTKAKTVLYEVVGKEGTMQTVSYDHLVITTGTRNWNPHQTPRAVGDRAAELEIVAPFKPAGTTEETKNSVKQWGTKIAEANTIFIAGAGPTGVEAAAEIAENYPNKKVIIAAHAFLPMVRPKIAAIAKSQLSKLGVDIRTGANVTSVTPSTTGSGVDIVLSTGETIPADLYIPAFGQKPNTEFLPSEILDKDGYVITSNYFNLPGHPEIWSFGDVTSFPGNRKVSVVVEQSPVIAFNLNKALAGETTGWKEYKHSTELQVMLTAGKKGGTGQFNGWRLWSWLVWLFKARDMMVSFMPKYMAGSVLPKKL